MVCLRHRPPCLLHHTSNCALLLGSGSLHKPWGIPSSSFLGLALAAAAAPSQAPSLRRQDLPTSSWSGTVAGRPGLGPSSSPLGTCTTGKEPGVHMESWDLRQGRCWRALLHRLHLPPPGEEKAGVSGNRALKR